MLDMVCSLVTGLTTTAQLCPMREGEEPGYRLEGNGMRLIEFQAMSFDCYGTLIDWEAGLAGVLTPWAIAAGLELDGEALLAAYSRHEADAEAAYPHEAYPEILARSIRALGSELG